MSDVTPEITISPIPPTQGQQVTLTYTGANPNELVLTWELADGSESTQAVMTGDDGQRSVA